MKKRGALFQAGTARRIPAPGGPELRRRLAPDLPVCTGAEFRGRRAASTRERTYVGVDVDITR